MISDCKTLTTHPHKRGRPSHSTTKGKPSRTQPTQPPITKTKNQAKPCPIRTGYLASIFRHTVEFSKSGRTQTTPLKALVLGQLLYLTLAVPPGQIRVTGPIRGMSRFPTCLTIGARGGGS